MKRIITAVAVIFLMAATSFAQTTAEEKSNNERWLDRYEMLVKRMQTVATDSVSYDSIQQWRSERAAFRSDYKNVYKDSLSDSEDERYFSLNSQYNKTLTKLRASSAGRSVSGVGEKLNDVGDKLSDVGESVKDKTKKVASKISGWFKGLKK